MNEEEKKARAFLRFYVRDIKDEYFDRDYHIDKKFAETILILIEKQERIIKTRLKEIEGLYKMMSVKDDKIEKLKEELKEIITEFIPESNHECILRTKLIKLLGE